MVEKITYLLFHISHPTNYMEVFLSHIQQRQGDEMANKIKNEYNTLTHPTVSSLSFAVCEPREEDRHFLLCRDSLWWMVFFSSLHLDHERITENIRVYTLTCDGGENHLFAFSQFSDFHSFIPKIIMNCSSHILQ